MRKGCDVQKEATREGMEKVVRFSAEQSGHVQVCTALLKSQILISGNIVSEVEELKPCLGTRQGLLFQGHDPTSRHKSLFQGHKPTYFESSV
jgi:hypothetical protein